MREAAPQGGRQSAPAGPRVGGQPGGPHFGRAADEDDGAQKAQKAKTGAGKAALARREVTPREAPGEGIRKTDKPARQGLLEPCPVCLEAAARPALMLALSSAMFKQKGQAAAAFVAGLPSADVLPARERWALTPPPPQTQDPPQPQRSTRRRAVSTCRSLPACQVSKFKWRATPGCSRDQVV